VVQGDHGQGNVAASVADACGTEDGEAGLFCAGSILKLRQAGENGFGCVFADPRVLKGRLQEVGHVKRAADAADDDIDGSPFELVWEEDLVDGRSVLGISLDDTQAGGNAVVGDFALREQAVKLGLTSDYCGEN
jgi:hypothetical protein